MKIALILMALVACLACAQEDSLLPLTGDKPPRTFGQMWAGFDPRAEPLETETLKQWEEDGVVLRVVRYRVGIFKGRKAMMAGVYGYPKGGDDLPGLVQIHGGGQYADYRAPLYNAKRGYATISIAWAGRILAPDYRVTPNEVKLFWEGKTSDPRYRVTTDWGAVDGYHAPSRHPQTVFPSAKPTPWTVDPVESPRNSPWFLCALAARRALTFLEQQPEVDATRLGVYGHSMGGKLTVMTAAADQRVKAAAPSCGGLSDRDNSSELYRAAIGDDANLKHVSCPIIFLSPANDFHGCIHDLVRAVAEMPSRVWRVTCAAHHNHQDTEPYMVAGPLWFDQHLKGAFTFPRTPQTELTLQTATGAPEFSVTPDSSRKILSVDIYYTQPLKDNPRQQDRDDNIHRFWHHAGSRREGDVWKADLSVHTADRPLWVLANVLYPLDHPVTGAGYYYAPFTADTFNLSSLVRIASPADLKAAGVRPGMKPSLVIETFEGDWEKDWFTYDLSGDWARRTHKVYDPTWKAPAFAKLALDVRYQQPNTLVVGIDGYAAAAPLHGGGQWQTVILFPTDFQDAVGRSFLDWSGIMELRLSAAETLRPPRDVAAKPRHVGGEWKGPAPRFRNLRWLPGTKAELNAHRTVKLPEPTPEHRRAYLTAEHADALTSFRPPLTDTDMNGKPLVVDGKTYPHGITVHAPSKAVFFLGGKFARFHAIAAAGRLATVVFQVVVDDRKVYDSGLLKRAASRVIELPVSGAQELQLIVTDGGNGIGGDWAHWVDAWVVGPH